MTLKKTKKASANQSAVVGRTRKAPSRAKSSAEPMSHLEARQVILDAESSSDWDVRITTELPAIVSHWLQHTESEPLVVPAGTGEKWRRTLRSHAGLGDAGDAAAPRIDFSSVPFPPPATSEFTFIDLFAGIGGFRLALQRIQGRCVFSSEWDKKAKETYEQNYGEVPFGDIRSFTGEDISDEEIAKLIPDHDIMAGGFPCQPFSRAGVSARTSLGQDHGFSCEIQGTLFFDMMRIAKVKRPRVLLLENVKNLQSHDGKRTFERIKTTIEQDLKYSFQYAILDASTLVPQRRQRCYIVCFRDGQQFEFPKLSGEALPLKSALERDVPDRYTLSDRMWQGHINRTKRNLDRGAGFTAFEADLSKPSNTLVARYYKDGKECLIPQPGKNPRLLTPRECANLQGYPRQFIPHPVPSHAYRQFGNSVAVPVVASIANRIVEVLK